MMNLEEQRIVRKLSRRGFMGTSAGAVLAALAGGAPQLARAAGLPATADSLIVLWMAGGMAQTETFDPKRYTPFAPGVPTAQVLSTFPSIDTAVDGIRFSQGLERTARVMDRGALIRTFQGADLGFILHSRHQYHWHTGYIPPQTVAMPHIGAVIARTLGPRNPTVPPFVAIGQDMEIGAESPALKSFHTGGFLGSEYGPFLISDPQDAASAVRPPAELGDARFHSRRKLYEQLLASEPVYQYAGDFQRQSLIRSLDAARPPADLALGQGVRPLAGTGEKLSGLQHGAFRTGLFAGATPGGSGRALYRGDHGIRSLPLLGLARKRPRARAHHEGAGGRADRAVDSGPGRARPAQPHAGGAGQRVRPRRHYRG